MIAPNPLRASWDTVQDCAAFLHRAETGLGQFPSALKRLLQTEAWREFELPSGEMVIYERFADFVAADLPRGLGADAAIVRRMVAEDAEALSLLDAAVQRPNHRPLSSDNSTTYDDSDPNMRGTSKDYALRKLRTDAPELHERVLAGSLSAHAAMVEAGFRPRTFTVRADRPQSVARSLRKNLSLEQLTELRQLLAKEGEE